MPWYRTAAKKRPATALYETLVAEVASIAPPGSDNALNIQLSPVSSEVYSPRLVALVDAPSMIPSDVEVIAATTVFIFPAAVLKARRAPPSPANDRAPLFEVGITFHVLPA